MSRSRFVQDGIDYAFKLVGNESPELGVRLDAGESVFFERQLEAVEGRLYEKKLRPLLWRLMFPTSNFGAGSTSITYYIYTKVGMAKIIANPADDLPRVDVFASRHTAQVRVLGESIGFSTQEIRNAMFANHPLEAHRASSARRGMEEAQNDLVWNGDADHDLLGVLNNPNIPQAEVVAALGGGASKIWGEDKTPTEVIADIATPIREIKVTTKNIHKPNVLALPIDKLEYISLTPVSPTFPTKSILNYIMDPDNRFGLEQIEAIPELEASGPAGAAEMLLYEKDPELVEVFIPLEMQSLPPQPRNLAFEIPIESEFAGVVWRYPLSAKRVYGF